MSDSVTAWRWGEPAEHPCAAAAHRWRCHALGHRAHRGSSGRLPGRGPGRRAGRRRSRGRRPHRARRGPGPGDAADHVRRVPVAALRRDPADRGAAAGVGGRPPAGLDPGLLQVGRAVPDQLRDLAAEHRPPADRLGQGAPRRQDLGAVERRRGGAAGQRRLRRHRPLGGRRAGLRRPDLRHLQPRAGGRLERRPRHGHRLHRRLAPLGGHLPGRGRDERHLHVDHDVLGVRRGRLRPTAGRRSSGTRATPMSTASPATPTTGTPAGPTRRRSSGSRSSS